MAENEDIRQRLERLELLMEAIAAKVGIPLTEPVIPEPPRPTVFETPTVLQPSSAATPPKPLQTPFVVAPPRPKPERTNDDTEFLIGRKYLPVAGATITVLGFICLAILAISRGWVNPRTQFGVELVLCAAFGVFGAKKSNEKENFGSILIGVSLAGFYLSLSGAFFYKALLTGEAYITCVVIVSLVSYLASWWRSSKAFLCLGFIGCSVSSCMAIYRGEPVIGAAIFGMTMVPCWALIARNKWAGVGIPIWMASFVVSAAAILSKSNLSAAEQWFLISSFWGYSMIGGYSVLRTDPGKTLVSKELVYLGAYVTMMTPLIIVNYPGSVFKMWPAFGAIAVAGALGVALANFRLTKEFRDMSIGAWVSAAAMLAPTTLTANLAVVTYSVVAIVVAIIARQTKSKELIALSGMQAAAATIAYCVVANYDTSTALISQLPYVVCALIAVLSVVGLVAPSQARERWFFVSSGVSYALLWRIVFLTFPRLPQLESTSLCWSSVAFAIAVSVIGTTTRSRVLAVWAVVSLTIGMVTAVSWSSITTGLIHDKQYVLAYLIAGFAMMRVMVPAYGGKVETTIVACTAFLWAVFARLAWLLFVGVRIDTFSASIDAIALTTIILAAIAAMQKWRGMSALSALVLCSSIFPFVAYLVAPSVFGAWLRRGELVADAVLFCTALVVVWAGIKSSLASKERVIAISVIPLGMIVVRWLYLILVWPPMSWQNVFAVEVVLLCLGIGIAIAGILQKWKDLAVSGLVYLIAALALYPTMKVPEFGFMIPPTHTISRQDHLTILIGLLVLSLALGKAFVSTLGQKPIVYHLASLTNWAIVSGLFIHTLDLPPLSLTFDASVSLGWTSFAAIILILGFRYQIPVLRYWALGIFGAGIVKVILYDLAFLDPAVKVVVLMALGIVMIGGGYAYIRSQQGQDSEGESDPIPTDQA